MAEGSRTLAHEVTDAFRIVIASALAMTAVLVATLTWFTTVGIPSFDHTTRVVTLSQNLSSSLIEEQSMLRAFVVTGDRTALSGYAGIQARIAADRAQLASASIGTGSTDLVTSADHSIVQWQQNWADLAAQPSSRLAFVAPNGDLNPVLLANFVRSGRQSFAATQAAAHKLTVEGLRAQSRSRHWMIGVAIGTALLLLLIGIAAIKGTLSRRLTLHSRVVGPIGVLLAKVQAVGRGEFGPSPAIDAPHELLELRDELADMSASLKLQQQVLAARADTEAASARRMKLVVDFAREVSGSLTLVNVFAAVTSAGRRLVESPRARVWLLDDDHRLLRLRYDSITGDVVGSLTHTVGKGSVGRAAADHSLYYGAGLTGDAIGGVPPLVVAVPLLKGTRLIGVLEIALQLGADRLDSATVEVLNATASHAATAIDAALLYALSESLSRSDPLTGLANRRQLDTDLELEIERSGRYGRPLSFLMVDIDHFKAVNDTFGHALGDSVLCEVADVLRGLMRSGDTVYRYGGEEFAVLARETDLTGGHVVAERLRRAIQELYASAEAGDVAVTISIGLSSVNAEVDTAEDLMSAADAALYEAKRAGRNRVRVSGADSDVPIPVQARAVS